jgi:hypothetical protein
VKISAQYIRKEYRQTMIDSGEDRFLDNLERIKRDRTQTALKERERRAQAACVHLAHENVDTEASAVESLPNTVIWIVSSCK